MAEQLTEQAIQNTLNEASASLGSENLSSEEAAQIFENVLSCLFPSHDAEIKILQERIVPITQVLNAALSQVAPADRRYSYFSSIVAFMDGRFSDYLEDTRAFMETMQKTEGPGWLNWHHAEKYFLRVLWYLPSRGVRNSTLENRILRAIRDYSRTYFPESAMARFCSFLMVDGQLNYRTKVLDTVLRKDPHWASAWVLKGDLLAEGREWQGALEAYEKALEDSYMRVPSLYYAAARAQEHLKNSDEACALYEKCLELDPSFPLAHARLGRCLNRLRRYPEAETHLRQALETDENKTIAGKALLQNLEKSGRASEALAMVQKHPEIFKVRDYRQKAPENAPAAAESGIARIERRLQTSGTTEPTGTIAVSDTLSRIHMYPYQETALEAIEAWDHKKSHAPGLVITPTGGDNTFTSIYWLAHNVLNEGSKVLWLSKNPEMLSVVAANFKRVSHKDVLPDRDELRYQIIFDPTGDEKASISPDSDILIATRRGFTQNLEALEGWLQNTQAPVYLVIGEAHLVPRQIYRQLIRSLRESTKDYHMIGLTSYPFNAGEMEKGVAGRVFPDANIYAVDLSHLINDEILAKPFFSTVETHVNMKNLFAEAGLGDLYAQLSVNDDLDLDSPQAADANTLIGDNGPRNTLIADTYASNKGMYGQTLIFAVNPRMAVALDQLLKDRGIRSDYVLSDVRDNAGELSRTPRENAEVIEKFRAGELDVIVNVNLFTGDVNLPQAQTAFLTKPSKSPIRLSKTAERVLRGPKTGGTHQANIISFMDQWSGTSLWLHPERLFIDANSAFRGERSEDQRYMIRLISLIKSSILAHMEAVEGNAALNIPFLENLPLGFLHFDFYSGDVDEVMPRSILIYDAHKESIAKLVEWMQEADLSDMEAAVQEAWSLFLADQHCPHGCEISQVDVRNLLSYYREAEALPEWVAFDNREDFDLAPLAHHIIEHNLDETQTTHYLEDEWHRAGAGWVDLFGYHSFPNFQRRVMEEVALIQPQA